MKLNILNILVIVAICAAVVYADEPRASCEEHELAWIVCGEAEKEMVSSAQRAVEGTTCRVFMHQTKIRSIERGDMDEIIAEMLLSIKCDDVRETPPGVIWGAERSPLIVQFGLWHYTRPLTVREGLEGQLDDDREIR